ncbi:MAG: response regulator [Myxococcota bacterium]
MADESKPNSPPSRLTDEGAGAGRLAHRMNNALSYVLTNLNLLSEELEAGHLTEERRRMLQLAVEATAGIDRLGDLIRELKVMGWEQDHRTDSQDDTWDEERGPRRVLVVDDEPYILASIHRALRHYDVVVADGGERAIALLRDDPAFDVVLCDLVMTNVSGMDVHRWVSLHRPELLERVIFMTAGAFAAEVREFLATVSNPVLHKPFDTKTLRWMIAQAARRP